MPNNSESLISKAEKLANGKTGHSPTPKPGFLQHSLGRWRDPKVHEQVIDLYSQAVAAEAAEGSKLGFALYRRALEHYYVGALDSARADQQALVASGSKYGLGSLPIWIELAAGNKAEAKRHLDALNVVNAQAGRPKQKLTDFEL